MLAGPNLQACRMSWVKLSRLHWRTKKIRHTEQRATAAWPHQRGLIIALAKGQGLAVQTQEARVDTQNALLER